LRPFKPRALRGRARRGPTPGRAGPKRVRCQRNCGMCLICISARTVPRCTAAGARAPIARRHLPLPRAQILTARRTLAGCVWNRTAGGLGARVCRLGCPYHPHTLLNEPLCLCLMNHPALAHSTPRALPCPGAQQCHPAHSTPPAHGNVTAHGGAGGGGLVGVVATSAGRWHGK
jgi:hypothetical protein